MYKIFLGVFLVIASLNCYSQGRNISSITKKIVYTRDGGKCKCCQSTIKLEFDHIVPYSCGGSSNQINIQLLCQKCNRSKSNSCYCKIHNRTVGINCCDENTKKKKINLQAQLNTSHQCTGITKKGTRCKNLTNNPSYRCHLH